MKITRTLLEENQACIPQKEIFIAEFPEGMDLTRENLERCITLKLPIEWLQCLLPIKRLETYEVTCATARATLDETRATLDATCATARATFRLAIINPLLDAFKGETKK